jgi:repressor LexA
MDAITAKPKLTARQEEILGLITDAISKSGLPPTRAEIATRLGFASANAAEEHLRALARKGYVELTPGTSRGIRLPKQMHLPLAALHQLTLPLIGRVAAGSPILAEEHVSATYQVDPSLFTAKPDYLLKVRGMSMRDAGILDGDLLAVKKTDSARDGQIVVARLDDDVTVKRFRRNGSSIELLPENPDFDVIRVEPGSHEFALEGLAVGLLRAWG